MTHHEELKQRSPDTVDAARQLRKSATSVAANYRAAGLARSDDEFVAKMGIVREEADECGYWLEYLEAITDTARRDLRLEAAELRNIFRASYATARRNLENAKAQAPDRKGRRHRHPM